MYTQDFYLLLLFFFFYFAILLSVSKQDPIMGKRLALVALVPFLFIFLPLMYKYLTNICIAEMKGWYFFLFFFTTEDNRILTTDM